MQIFLLLVSIFMFNITAESSFKQLNVLTKTKEERRQIRVEKIEKIIKENGDLKKAHSKILFIEILLLSYFMMASFFIDDVRFSILSMLLLINLLVACKQFLAWIKDTSKIKVNNILISLLENIVYSLYYAFVAWNVAFELIK